MASASIKWILAIVLLAIVAVGAYLAFRPTETEKQDLVLRLKWLHQAQFAGFYEAQEDGLYESASLKLRIEQGGPDFPAITQVLSGNETFGVTGADQILLARSQGADIVPLFVVYRESPFVLFAPKERGINSPKDFPGKKIGVKRGGNEELIYRALLTKAGVSVPASDEVPVQFDLAPLLSGSVDVWPGYAINEPLAVENEGVPVTIFKPSDSGVSLYADTVFTKRETIEKQPEMVRAFITASLEGWARAVKDPKKAGETSLKYATSSNIEHQTKMMEASLPYIDPDGSGIGLMTLKGWEQTQDLLLEGGFLQSKVDLPKMLAEAQEAGAPVR